MNRKFINRMKLRGLLAENNLSQMKLAEELNISYQMLSMKLNDHYMFTEREIAILYNIFHTLDLFNLDI